MSKLRLNWEAKRARHVTVRLWAGKDGSHIMPSSTELAQAKARCWCGSEKVAVQGPHLRVLRRKSNTKTGVVGISISRSKDGKATYFSVCLGRTARKFRIETLGREEAWRRALRLRAEQEARILAANAAILEAREANNA